MCIEDTISVEAIVDVDGSNVTKVEPVMMLGPGLTSVEFFEISLQCLRIDRLISEC
jgi:hypothetical protein